MLRMPSLLQSRSDLLQLVEISWLKANPAKFLSMATGCSLNSALRYQEGKTPRCSARQNRSTGRAFCGPQRAEDHSYCLSYEEYERYQKHWYLTLNKSGKNAPMRLPSRSHINEPSPPRIRRRTSRTNPFSTVPEVAPVFFQFFMVEFG